MIVAGLMPFAAWASYTRRNDQGEPIAADDPTQLPATLPEQSFLEVLNLATSKQTRGERNNNPGNIRLSGTQWQGQVKGSDPAFATFATPEAGIRALAKLLKNYQAKYGLNTVRQLIGRWAPPNENNTAAYVASVAAALGVGPDQQIDVTNPDTLQRLTAAIIRHENGRVVYAQSTINQGVMQA